MEKFTKFDDHRTGVNPFVPVRTERMGVLLGLLKFALIVPIFVLRLALLIVLFVPYRLLHLVKYIVLGV